jgi:hypothetical protein
VSFLKNLFSHHSSPQSASAQTHFNWPGHSGTEYPYEIVPLDAAFKPLPANFIYAQQSEDGSWTPIYIAQTRDMHQRLEGHVSVNDAVVSGATHIHVHYCTTGQSARCTEERDLLLRWKPVCNDPVEED